LKEACFQAVLSEKLSDSAGSVSRFDVFVLSRWWRIWRSWSTPWSEIRSLSQSQNHPFRRRAEHISRIQQSPL